MSLWNPISSGVWKGPCWDGVEAHLGNGRLLAWSHLLDRRKSTCMLGLWTPCTALNGRRSLSTSTRKFSSELFNIAFFVVIYTTNGQRILTRLHCRVGREHFLWGKILMWYRSVRCNAVGCSSCALSLLIFAVYTTPVTLNAFQCTGQPQELPYPSEICTPI